jgi:hypothetical protein
MGLLSRLFQRGPQPETPVGSGRRRGIGQPPRLLFLDDDPVRAALFLTENPDADWVQTAAECIARLEESWEEVHLDHDLGGEQFVDHTRDDCGMEVVRWLCLHPRPHLRRTQFYVHSHNSAAATDMGMQLMGAGYHVELRPFGTGPLPPLPREFSGAGAANPRTSLVDWLRRRILGRPAPSDFGDPRPAIDGDDSSRLDRLDLGWTRPGALLPKVGDTPPCPDRLDLSWTAPPPSRTESGPPSGSD